jgi:hypothetical protein
MSTLFAPVRWLWRASAATAMFLITLQVFAIAVFLIAFALLWVADVTLGQTGIADATRVTLIHLLNGNAGATA